jgi:hypothetical protein
LRAEFSADWTLRNVGAKKPFQLALEWLFALTEVLLPQETFGLATKQAAACNTISDAVLKVLGASRAHWASCDFSARY